jgi:hypothetical protein
MAPKWDLDVHAYRRGDALAGGVNQRRSTMPLPSRATTSWLAAMPWAEVLKQ